MKHFKSIEKYCEAIGIKKPKYSHFDIRTFEENMPTVVHSIKPFRHEFYAIAIKTEGEGIAISGHHTQFPKQSTIFFNSPFQILSWDILPNWEGFYIIFTKDFIAQSAHLKDILTFFPFLKIDKAVPFEIGLEEVEKISSIYKEIYFHYHSNEKDKFIFIESYVLLLLNYIKRFFQKNVSQNDISDEIRKADIKLLSRFQTQLEASFSPNATQEFSSIVHSTSYYAEKLNVHPNHLNFITKSITGNTAKKHIQNYILQIAKSRLLHTEKSVKEIAYSLYFESPNNFSFFFKKHTSTTPNTFRKQHIL